MGGGGDGRFGEGRLGPSDAAKVGLKGSYSLHFIVKLTFLGARIGLGFRSFV